MAGEFSIIHGYNPLYRDVDTNTRAVNFKSFGWNPVGGRPIAFVSRRVAMENSRASQNAQQPQPAAYPRLDHQGHIVSQAIMNRYLNQRMIDLSAFGDTTAAALTTRIGLQPDFAWLQPVIAYANAMTALRWADTLTIAHDPAREMDTAEERLGYLFSYITWNPVNICRAPDDGQRESYPGDLIDLQVLARLNGVAGVNAGWLTAANNLARIAAPTPADIRAYIVASIGTLGGQIQAPTGFYMLPWRECVAPRV